MIQKKTFIQATAVTLDGCGVLITGPSGVGKSDMALRLIMEKQATLIGDDGVFLQKRNNSVFLFPHPETKGLLEVPGLGIVSFPVSDNAPLCLHVVLSNDAPDRLPATEDMQKKFEGVPVLSIQINPFHVSSIHRVLLAIEIAKNPKRLSATAL